MVDLMKTTIEIAEDLFARAREVARRSLPPAPVSREARRLSGRPRDLSRLPQGLSFVSRVLGNLPRTLSNLPRA